MENSYKIISEQVKGNCLIAIANLDLSGWEVEIRRKGKTPPQRRYWHKLLSILVQDTGYSLNDLKAIVKQKVLGVRTFKTRKGETVMRDHSSEELDVIGYGGLIDYTHELGRLAGTPLPQPRHYLENHGFDVSEKRTKEEKEATDR